ncbi:BatA domain-containing protein [Lentisphaera profundi]|uniref:BatA domain-containing protein n=1 Tax=Lentisphaera profundi TaxID=1658616 RepID=A0ABY7VQP9_9BACT|nr:BatA domain-containing protein [Lentisphaera profundi]WDE96530.1 BatA domain-containing protein [Lentisphaera profundi]
MTFLNPFLLWGLPLISVPVIIHLLRKNKVIEIEWAAMDFLMDAVQEQKKRFKMEDLLLLLLRTLVILFIILALARPIINSSIAGGSSSNLIALDDSLSMATNEGGRSRFARGLEASETIISSVKSRNALILVRSQPQNVIANFTPDRGLLSETFKQLKPASYDGDTLQSLKACGDLIDKQADTKPVLYFISDFQQSDWLNAQSSINEELQILKDKAEVVFIHVGDENQENRSITEIKTLQDAAKIGQEAWFAVKVKNHGAEDASDLEVKFFLDDDLRESRMASVPAGQTLDLIFKVEIEEEGYHAALAEISADSNLADNRAYTHFEAIEQKKVLIVQNFKPSNAYEKRSLFFDFALNPFANASASDKALYKFSWQDLAILETAELSEYAFVILDNVQAFTSSEMDAVEQYIASGGGLLINLGPDSDIENFNQSFVDSEIISEALFDERFEMKKDGDFLNTRISNSTSQLWSFTSKAEDLESFRVKKTYGFKKEDGSLMRSYMDLKNERGIFSIMSSFDYKQGKIFVFGSGFSLDWNNFATRPNFLPLSRQLSRELLRKEDKNESFKVGQAYVVQVDDDKSRSSYELQKPTGDKQNYNVEIRKDLSYLNIPQLNNVGIYKIQESGESTFKLISVNSKEKESQIQCMSIEQIQENFPEVKIIAGSDFLASTSSSGGASLASLFIILAGICYLAENILAMMISRRASA